MITDWMDTPPEPVRYPAYEINQEIPPLERVRRIHLIGVCGTGMGGLAGMLKQQGFRITGSDDNVYPPMSTYLENLGIEIWRGFDPAHLEPAPDITIAGNVCSANNPEARAAREQRLPTLSFPQALGRFLVRDRYSLVMCGTHGKTTSTALLAWVLAHAGRNPGYFIGGVTNNFPESCAMGGGPEVVLEGDEYDSAYFNKVPKFVHYRPRGVTLTNVDFDHMDIYPTVHHYRQAFKDLMALIPADGLLAVCAENDAAMRISALAKCPVMTYGTREDAQVRALELEQSPAGCSFTLLFPREEPRRMRLPLGGQHNALNALGVIIHARSRGLTLDQIQSAFDAFGGIRRRQEVRATVGGVTIMDDFAHHPAEVRATIQAVKSLYPGQAVHAIFEPRTNTSRRRVFQKDYVEALAGASSALIKTAERKHADEQGELFSSEELAADVSRMGTPARAIATVDEMVSVLRQEARPGDILLIMSNGGFGGIHDKLIAALRERFGDG